MTSVANVKLAPFFYIRSTPPQCTNPTVQAHSLVDRRLYRLLVNVSGLEGHLSSLKRLFLMGHGSLFHSFFDKAREAMKVKAGDR